MYYLTDDNKFVIENYNWETSFSNFFPAISGKTGIPMWVFYVSRGQAVISAGVKDKNNQIMEFRSFNRALESVGTTGFRTFIKTGKNKIYEPFRKTKQKNILQKMILSSAELEISEVNGNAGLETKVIYFPLANDDFPALIRILEIKNLKKNKINLDVIDGIPRVMPYGANLEILRAIPRHIEGMIGVFPKNGIPIFRLKQSPEDVVKIDRIDGGNFFISFSRGNPAGKNYIVDPRVVFGENEIYDFPWNFEKKSVGEILKKKQILCNKTPCAFKGASARLKSGEKIRLVSVLGQAPSDKEVSAISGKLTSQGYIARKRDENIRIIESIKVLTFTVSADRKFDEYSGQTFLDNAIRGGIPAVFSTASGKTAVYIYSRLHGDMERDYHLFVIEPTYFSQGNGFYRDVNQNRRCDVWFFPEIYDLNIKTFLNLIQTDGYNPLIVTQLTYSVTKKRKMLKWLSKLLKNKKGLLIVKDLLSKPFILGDFLMKLDKSGVNVKKDPDSILSGILRFCEENECGGIHEGFWVDHWLYNFDLLDTFRMIYPDKIARILTQNNDCYFYDNPDIVRPRADKFVLSNGRVMQYGAVERNVEKIKLIKSRRRNPSKMRTKYGKGEIYRTNLLVKILVMAVNRIATLDPSGLGIEMEAGKPGWNDSMNGLPGIMGSSLCQTLELEKALKFIYENLGKIKKDVKIYGELYEFLKKLEKAVSKRMKGGMNWFDFWNVTHAIKETYREKTAFGIDGAEKTIRSADLRKIIGIYLTLISGIFSAGNRKKIFAKNGVCFTYFEHRTLKYSFIRDKKGGKKLSAEGLPLVKPLSFAMKPLPLFLEGPVHMLKTHPEISSRIYQAVRKSPVFDRKLKMYKVCESLEKAPFEIGRVKAWGAGWLENESVYTHMEYKYLLEVLRSGLYEEFFRDIKTMLPPFLNPEIYGRSIFENVSFIASSSFPDEKMHGRGFQPRLSGVTSEMLTIWILMVAGKEPFFLDGKNALRFRLSPALPEWLFTKKPVKRGGLKINKNSFAFKLFGSIPVIYSNRKRKNTFGENGVSVKRYTLYYGKKKIVVVNSSVLEAKYAGDIRDRKVTKIEAVLE
ncbi:MAG: cellobiose phosphorylase [bacterium]